MSEEATELICACADESMKSNGLFTLVLSGGSTPRPVYEFLASDRYSHRIDWERTHLFWGDERLIPPDHPDSNYEMAYELLVSRVPIPDENVHPVPVDDIPPERVAIEYEKELRTFFKADVGGFPQFDLILLGMGVDGHTASLFPGDPALYERKRWVVAIDGKKGLPPVPRVTLTLPVINSAARVAFLINGEEKKMIMDEILSNPDDSAQKYPAARVNPNGKLSWIIS
jgi:6-phosphogluconolactonase